ncbi:MAG: YIP1 family protein [Nanoarchaeota archaeon]|nr:YIP1 family protein [Nanoarchaeota archaeon]
MDLIREKSIGGDGSGFIEKLRLVFFDPHLFFDKVDKEKRFNKILITLITLGTLLLVGIILFFLIWGNMGEYLGLNSFYFVLVAFVPVTLLFIYFGIVHVVVRLFEGSGDYYKTFNVVTYSLILGMLFGLIPVVGFLGWMYSVYFATIGLSKVHKISNMKAATSYLTPIIIYIGIITIVIYILFGGF